VLTLKQAFPFEYSRFQSLNVPPGVSSTLNRRFMTAPPLEGLRDRVARRQQTARLLVDVHEQPDAVCGQGRT
jgi:hypothetical protein